MRSILYIILILKFFDIMYLKSLSGLKCYSSMILMLTDFLNCQDTLET